MRIHLERLEASQTSLVDQAQSQALLGNREAALSLLEKAARERLHGLLFLAVEPGFDHLQNEPRFKSLLRILGLPDRHESGSGR